MPSGQPDFGLYAPTETIVSLSDMGELAARLGSIVTFDRRGNVFWLDDFESGVEKWERAGMGADWDLTWIATTARNGGFACRLRTGDTAGFWAEMAKYLSYPALSNIGFEIGIANGGYWDYFIMYLDLYNGTTFYPARVKYDKTTGKFYYWNSAGAWEDTGIITTLREVDTLFNIIKLVANFTDKEYHRLIVNNQQLDLTGLALEGASSGSGPYLVIALRLYTVSDNKAPAYIDDVIATQNEP